MTISTNVATSYQLLVWLLLPVTMHVFTTGPVSMVLMHEQSSDIRAANVHSENAIIIVTSSL